MGHLRVQQLGKAYRQYFTRWGRLREWVWPYGGPRHQLHWVLRDVSFEVSPGQAVGIIGVNGAGKSTLLKIIAGTTQPTEGHVEAHGHVAALLELGMGFHPEFTGRQNVVMAGQLLGIGLDEIQTLMPEVERFAEIGAAIDHPVRTYSSGMQMRLAFSIATAKRPDILIVDEALSVGDAYFQHKSFDRIRTFRKTGTTLLIVSHDPTAIQTICDRAILLDAGRLVTEGTPEAVMDYYRAALAERERRTVRQEALPGGGVRTISGTGEAAIEQIVLHNERGEASDIVEIGSLVTLEVGVGIHQPIDQLVLGFLIKDRFGNPIYGINTYRLEKIMTDLRPGEKLTYRFSFRVLFGKGAYSVALSLSRTDSHLDRNYEWRDQAMMIYVLNTHHEDFIGVTWLNATADVERPALTIETERRGIAS